VSSDRAAMPGSAAGERPLGVDWLIGLRVLLSVLSLIVILGDRPGMPWGDVLLDPPILVLLACFPLSGVYWLLAGRVGPGLVRTQVIIDLGLVSLVIYLTGGVESKLMFLYFGPILAASTLLSFGASLISASVCTISMSVITLVHVLASRYQSPLPLVSSGWLPVYTETTLGPQLVLLGGQAVSFYLVAALSGTLATRLEEARTFSRGVLEKIHEGVLTITADGRVSSLNQRARTLLGLTGEAPVTGRSWTEVCPPELREKLASVLDRLLPGRHARSLSETGAGHGHSALSSLAFEVVLPSGDKGTTVPVQVATFPVTDSRGRLQSIILVLIDLSERRRMEEALRQAERLEALNQAAAGIAHEIRNPIASIRASAQELMSSPDSDAGRRFNDRLLQVMVTESDRLNRIVSDFLGYARLRQASPAPCELAQVLDDVVLLLGKQARPDHTVSFGCPPGLRVEADREQLVQAFLNLGLNALDAMSTGGALRFEAVLAAEPTATGRQSEARTSTGARRCVVVSVTDEGCGISAEQRQQMFEPFFTTKARGTGMGLPIVKRIVESHGGRITVRSPAPGSSPGGSAPGTVFRVELPLEHVEPATEAPARAAQ